MLSHRYGGPGSIQEMTQEKLHPDKSYDFRRCRETPGRRNIVPASLDAEWTRANDLDGTGGSPNGVGVELSEVRHRLYPLETAKDRPFGGCVLAVGVCIFLS